MHDEIRKSLETLIAATRRADGQTVADEMARLDGIVERSRPGLHPQLTHFLERRSYAKALQFLGGDTDIPAGTCAPRR